MGVDRAVAAVDASLLVDAAGVLAGTASAAGDELAVAEVFAGWIAERVPHVQLEIDRFAAGRANLLIGAGAGERHLGMYAHLDTSLTGEPVDDEVITGRRDPVPMCRIDGRDLVGPGLAVAKAPAAAAFAAVAALASSGALEAAAHRVTLLLAAGGTHRLVGERGPDVRFGVGVRRALARGFTPGAVLNVKAGAPAPLHEEPGAAYLRVRLAGAWEPAPFRGDAPGLVAALGPLVGAVEQWRGDLRTRPVGRGRTWGREAALGAVRVGSLAKPDLLPAVVEAEVFVVLVDDDDPARLAAELGTATERALTAAGLMDVAVSVAVDAFDLPAATDPHDRIVRVVADAWEHRLGTPPAVTDWRGSTDGVVFRAAGIPTVRAGIAAARDHLDPRLDRVPIPALVEMARLYVEAACRWLGA